MAHFYAEIQGARGPASRCGSKQSGIWVHARGWNVGVEVEVRHSYLYQRDTVQIFRTGGSNGDSKQLVATFVEGKETDVPLGPQPLVNENERLKTQNASLQNTNTSLRTRIEQLQDQIQQLQRQVPEGTPAVMPITGPLDPYQPEKYKKADLIRMVHLMRQDWEILNQKHNQRADAEGWCTVYESNQLLYNHAFTVLKLTGRAGKVGHDGPGWQFPDRYGGQNPI